MQTQEANRPPSPWPYRLALATLGAAVPLLLIGGTVTSLEAGMAIDGWWWLEPGRGDHFLLFYPVEKWFRDVGTFVEHTHRLFGTLVGLLAIATWVAAWRLDRRRSAGVVALVGLLAVCAQGTLGGFRVLENSPELAFLHGAFGQLVFAILAASAVYLSPTWRRYAAGGDLELGAASIASAPHVVSRLGAPVVYGTTFLGAWLRHGSSHLALALHITAAMLAGVLVMALAGRLRHLGQQDAAAKPLADAGRRLFLLVTAQVLLGIASTWLLFVRMAPTAEGIHDALFPTLHVLVGAFLLAQLVAAAMWVQHLAAPGRVPSELEAVR